MNNFLPNCQWQLWTGLPLFQKQNAAGTAYQSSVTFTGFQTANNQPTCYTANTGELKLGDLVILNWPQNFWGYAGIGYVTTQTASRVIALVPNVSVTLQGNLGAVSLATSASVMVSPICPGDYGSGTGQCADGWKKTGTLKVWADDFSANVCIGAIRTLGIRKGAATTETVSWSVSPNQLRKYLGKTITFGILVYQKVQTGGTWRVSIYDNVNGTTCSANGTGVAYSDPVYGGFQYLSVTATINPTATAFGVWLECLGAVGDVYYVGIPTAVIGSTLCREACGQPDNDLMRPVTHWNPPLLTPLKVSFPATAYPGAPGLYGWSGIDLEAISLGQCHKSVSMVKAKIEWQTSTVGAYIFTGSKLDYSLVFGPQAATQVSGINCVGQGWLPLADDGTFTLFSGTPSLAPTAGTFDFDCVQLSMNSAAN